MGPLQQQQKGRAHDHMHHHHHRAHEHHVHHNVASYYFAASFGVCGCRLYAAPDLAELYAVNYAQSIASDEGYEGEKEGNSGSVLGRLCRRLLTVLPGGRSALGCCRFVRRSVVARLAFHLRPAVLQNRWYASCQWCLLREDVLGPALWSRQPLVAHLKLSAILEMLQRRQQPSSRSPSSSLSTSSSTAAVAASISSTATARIASASQSTASGITVESLLHRLALRCVRKAAAGTFPYRALITVDALGPGNNSNTNSTSGSSLSSSTSRTDDVLLSSASLVVPALVALPVLTFLASALRLAVRQADTAAFRSLITRNAALTAKERRAALGIPKRLEGLFSASSLAGGSSSFYQPSYLLPLNTFGALIVRERAVSPLLWCQSPLWHRYYALRSAHYDAWSRLAAAAASAEQPSCDGSYSPLLMLHTMLVATPMHVAHRVLALLQWDPSIVRHAVTHAVMFVGSAATDWARLPVALRVSQTPLQLLLTSAAATRGSSAAAVVGRALSRVVVSRRNDGPSNTHDNSEVTDDQAHSAGGVVYCASVLLRSVEAALQSHRNHSQGGSLLHNITSSSVAGFAPAAAVIAEDRLALKAAFVAVRLVLSVLVAGSPWVVLVGEDRLLPIRSRHVHSSSAASPVATSSPQPNTTIHNGPPANTTVGAEERAAALWRTESAARKKRDDTHQLPSSSQPGLPTSIAENNTRRPTAVSSAKWSPLVRGSLRFMTAVVTHPLTRLGILHFFCAVIVLRLATHGGSGGEERRKNVSGSVGAPVTAPPTTSSSSSSSFKEALAAKKEAVSERSTALLQAGATKATGAVREGVARRGGPTLAAALEEKWAALSTTAVVMLSSLSATIQHGFQHPKASFQGALRQLQRRVLHSVAGRALATAVHAAIGPMCISTLFFWISFALRRAAAVVELRAEQVFLEAFTWVESSLLHRYEDARRTLASLGHRHSRHFTSSPSLSHQQNAKQQRHRAATSAAAAAATIIGQTNAQPFGSVVGSFYVDPPGGALQHPISRRRPSSAASAVGAGVAPPVEDVDSVIQPPAAATAATESVLLHRLHPGHASFNLYDQAEAALGLPAWSTVDRIVVRRVRLTLELEQLDARREGLEGRLQAYREAHRTLFPAVAQAKTTAHDNDDGEEEDHRIKEDVPKNIPTSTLGDGRPFNKVSPREEDDNAEHDDDTTDIGGGGGGRETALLLDATATPMDISMASALLDVSPVRGVVRTADQSALLTSHIRFVEDLAASEEDEYAKDTKKSNSTPITTPPATPTAAAAAVAQGDNLPMDATQRPATHSGLVSATVSFRPRPTSTTNPTETERRHTRHRNGGVDAKAAGGGGSSRFRRAGATSTSKTKPATTFFQSLQSSWLLSGILSAVQSAAFVCLLYPLPFCATPWRVVANRRHFARQRMEALYYGLTSSSSTTSPSTPHHHHSGNLAALEGGTVLTTASPPHPFSASLSPAPPSRRCGKGPWWWRRWISAVAVVLRPRQDGWMCDAPASRVLLATLLQHSRLQTNSAWLRDQWTLEVLCDATREAVDVVQPPAVSTREEAAAAEASAITVTHTTDSAALVAIYGGAPAQLRATLRSYRRTFMAALEAEQQPKTQPSAAAGNADGNPTPTVYHNHRPTVVVLGDTPTGPKKRNMGGGSQQQQRHRLRLLQWWLRSVPLVDWVRRERRLGPRPAPEALLLAAIPSSSSSATSMSHHFSEALVTEALDALAADDTALLLSCAAATPAADERRDDEQGEELLELVYEAQERALLPSPQANIINGVKSGGGVNVNGDGDEDDEYVETVEALDEDPAMAAYHQQRMAFLMDQEASLAALIARAENRLATIRADSALLSSRVFDYNALAERLVSGLTRRSLVLRLLAALLADGLVAFPLRSLAALIEVRAMDYALTGVVAAFATGVEASHWMAVPSPLQPPTTPGLDANESGGGGGGGGRLLEALLLLAPRRINNNSNNIPNDTVASSGARAVLTYVGECILYESHSLIAALRGHHFNSNPTASTTTPSSDRGSGGLWQVLFSAFPALEHIAAAIAVRWAVVAPLYTGLAVHLACRHAPAWWGTFLDPTRQQQQQQEEEEDEP